MSSVKGHFTVAHNQKLKTYEMLDTLPFSSDRKRMTVFAQLVNVDGVDIPGIYIFRFFLSYRYIFLFFLSFLPVFFIWFLLSFSPVYIIGVKDDSAWVSLFCKGADDVILPRLEAPLDEDVRILNALNPEP